jgi:hypothetical protein
MEVGLTEQGMHTCGWRICACLLPIIAALVLWPLAGAASAAVCSNEPFRTGASAGLPDCRAYELVSPSDSNGRLLETIGTFGFGTASNSFPTELLSSDGDSAVFMTDNSPLLLPSEANGASDLYETRRTPGGWQAPRLMSPSGVQAVQPTLGGVSADHGYTFSHVGPDENRSGGTLAGETGADYLGKPDGSFQLVGIGSLGSEPLAEGRYISSSGQHVIFSTGKLPTQSDWCAFKGSLCQVRRLSSEAPPAGTGAVYDRPADGLAHVVSLLPTNVTPTAGQESIYKGSSKDASSVAFEIGSTLYVRVHNGEAGAETEEVTGGSPVFAGVSADGRYVFYVAGGEDGTIHRFDTTDEGDVELNPTGDGEVVNVSADGSHVYFVSRSVLTGSETNPNDEVALAPAKGSGELTAAKGSGHVEKGSTTVTGVSTSEGTFEVGMQITGNEIPEGTTIEAVGTGTLVLSQPGTGSGSTTLDAGSFVVKNVATSEGTFEAGMEISGEGIRSHTTIEAVGAGSLTLSQGVTKSGTVALEGSFPNLYVWTAAATKFVGTVAPSDLLRTSGSAADTPALTRWTSYAVSAEPSRGPGGDSSRSTPTGSVLIFESRARLEPDYDNAGHTEVYRYDEADASLICVSCNPDGQPANADARLQETRLVGSPIVLHNVSDDGSRIFFETSEELLSTDTGATNDIYEWRDADGLSLISSGSTKDYPLAHEGEGLPKPNVMMSVTPSGDDVLFMTQQALTPGAGEGGTEALYDARVGGGFAPPAVPHLCVEEECKPAGTVGPSVQPQAASESVRGSGNVRPRCSGRPAAKHARKGHRCHHHRHRRKKAGRSRAYARLSASSDRPSGPAVTASAVTSTGASQQSAGSSAGGSIPPAAASTSELEEFKIESFAAATSTAEAGAHPDFTVSFDLKHGKNGAIPVSSVRPESVTVTLPPGLLGNPNAIPRCEMGQLVSFGNCPLDSQVGVATNEISNQAGVAIAPIYNLVPPHPETEVARLGFIGAIFPVFIDVHVRTAGDYGVTATVHSAPAEKALLASETTLWGDPSDPVHDKQRFTTAEAIRNCPIASECEPEGGPRSIEPLPAFMSNPAACQGGTVGLAVTTYQLPGQVFSTSSGLPSTINCTGLPFAPHFTAEPTSHVAGAPTGLETELKLPQHEGPDERATATMREARVTLPAGMQIAAGAANWVGTCSDRQVGFHEEVDAACPDASKLGTATIVSPAVSTPLHGFIYQRTPLPGHQFGLWLVTDDLGLHVKLPGEIEPDPRTGRLTAVFRDLPQVPVSEIDLDVWGGSRAPLQNPDRCGIFTTDYSFLPHSNDPAASGQSQMTIDAGCDKGFSPTVHGGVTKPVAGRFSPLVIDLNFPDGEQALRGFTLTLPDGELAKLKGVPLCSGAAAAAGSCPAASAIGHLVAAAGPGPEPLWVPQPGKAEPKLYLAGPYQGSPFSVVTVVPAQAGPFDLGNVVVRSGLGLDPDSNRAVVKADPLPQFFEGVGLTYRRLHIVVDRPGFSLNPTDCREMHIQVNAASTQGATANPASRFQLKGCRRLKFKPQLSLQLKGGTERGDYPALTATVKARKGDANIGRAVVDLPHSEFLAQEHIGTICTRKQFAADKCPKRSVYGRAKVWTPLLAKPLQGPVYLRSSDHPLPDLVVALGGELDVNLDGRIDSHHGGIRTTFAQVPDAPITRFVLNMEGGKKGLLVNSTDICRGRHSAKVALGAQNGRKLLEQPLLRGRCGR